MFDLRYHIASLVAIFLALGLGILIGSTIVGDDLMVEQQQKMINGLEDKFTILRERESDLLASNEEKDQIIDNYENFSRALLPIIVNKQLQDRKVALVVTGEQDVPAGLINALSIAGVDVVSRTVVLKNIDLKDDKLKERLIDFYSLEEGTKADDIRKQIASNVALTINGNADPGLVKFLEENKLLKFSGEFDPSVDSVIMVGGSNNFSSYFPDSLDNTIIDELLQSGKKVVGVEESEVKLSYMQAYEKFDIATIDNIDQSPGQISLVLSMKGEPGDYGIKVTATKFMPSLPLEYLRGE